MEGRLDLAMALVHGPSILFLDEPTTGLDPQSRSALWDEVPAPGHRRGRHRLPTTQYLEEADVLADRVGIIDRGTSSPRGSLAVLKREIGGDTVEAVPPTRTHRPRGGGPRALRPAAAPHSPKGVAVRTRHGAGLAEIVRALDDEGIAVEQPAGALAVAGRRLPGQDRALAGGRRVAEADAGEPVPA